MSDEDLALLRGLYSRWSTGDFATPDAFDPEVVYSRIGGGGGVGLEGTWHGIEEMWLGVREWLRSWDAARVTAEEMVTLDDGRVLVLNRLQGRGRQSGITIERPSAAVFTIRDGKVVRFDDYWERGDALRAVGMQPG